MKKFIVASASPRRRELLKNSGYCFEVMPSDADETLPENISTEQAVCLLAKRKALAVLENNKDGVVLGCDTVVALCIADSDREETFANVTEVEFYPLSEETVESYASSGECDDKAGSYGIQGLGSVLVKEIKGDYFSVMGLPVAQTARVLKSFGIEGSVKV